MVQTGLKFNTSYQRVHTTNSYYYIGKVYLDNSKLLEEPVIMVEILDMSKIHIHSYKKEEIETLFKSESWKPI